MKNHDSRSDTPISEGEYVRSVEAKFRALRQRPLLLSPVDFRLAVGWYREKIPVSIVVAALEDVFERAGEPDRHPRSLSYCEPAVKEAWKEFEHNAPSTHARASRSDLAREAQELLDRTIARLEKSRAPAPAIEAAVRALRSLAKLDASRHVHDPVVKVESQLVDACLTALNDEQRTALEQRAQAALDGLGQDVDDALRARVLRASLAHNVRAEFDLPDLSRIPYPFPR